MSLSTPPLVSPREVARRAERRFLTMRMFGDAPAREREQGELPPGPRWPAFAQTVGLLRFRHRFMPALARRYGDVFSVRILPGGRPIVLHSTPEQTKEIFAGDPEVFHAGKANAILGPLMGSHSLLLVDGADHKRARALLMPAFNGRALRSYQGLIAEIAAAEVATWRDGEEFPALQRMNRLTLDVILQVVFGISDEQRLARLRPLVNRVVDISPTILLGWNFPRVRKIGPWKAMVDTAIELDTVIYEQIAEHRQAPDLDSRSDVLSALLRVESDGAGLSDEEVRDQLVTLLLAGHETTATALSWALYEIGRSAAIHARAVEAAHNGDEAFLEALLKEAMRLHPVIPMVVRSLQQPAEVAGRSYPAGVTVGPSIILAHQREEAFPDPERYDPDRFLGQSPPTNSWIPFGGGVRRCIGAGFSLMEGVAILQEIFSHYDVEARGTDGPKVRNITSVPRRGARVRVTRR